MLRHFRFIPPAVAALVSVFALAGPARAFDAADPLGTDRLAPPHPRLPLAGLTAVDASGAGCRQPMAEAPLDVLAAVETALCNNPLTREVWASARAQAALVGVAQGAFLPELDARAGITRQSGDVATERQRTASLGLAWLLFDFGARDASLENARQLLIAATASFDATLHGLFLSAVQAYHNAQAARAALAAARLSEKASQESLIAAETRYRVGTGTPADRLQAQTAWSQATLARIRAEGEVRNADGVLANVMGFDASRPLQLAELPAQLPESETGAAQRDVDVLIAEARQRRPDLQAAEAQLAAAQAAIDAARASGRPSLSLGASTGWQRSDGIGAHSSSLGLTLSIPLFSGYETTYRVRTAEAQHQSRSAQRERLRQQVALDVWRAYQALGTAGQSLKTTADLLASAEQSERVALGRYKAGVGTILDVLNAQSALAAARQQRIQAMLDWRVSRATLAQAIGTLDTGLLQTPATGTPLP